MQNLGILEAIARWFDGQKLDSMTLYGWPILYWGRLGKLLTFIGGAVAIVDLVGPEALRRWGARYRSKVPRILFVVLPLAGVFLYFTFAITGFHFDFESDNRVFEQASELPVPHAGPAIPPTKSEAVLITLPLLFAIISFALAHWVSKGAARLLVWAFDNERPALAVKWMGYFLLFIGFFLDFLAS
jgi:hypothetical protein